MPHRKSYVIGREPLLEIVDRAELGLADDAALPEKVILLARPDPRELADTPADDLLIRCWRLLFHARIHVALDESTASGGLSPAAVRRRIQQIGPAEFDEIRMVLGQEDLLLPPRSDASIYVEFVAVYLELRYFAASFLPRYFPGLENLEAVDELVRQDVDAERLFRATRPQARPIREDRCELAESGRLADGARIARRRARAARRASFRDEVSPADAQVAAAGVAGQRGAGGHLSGAGRAVCAAGVRRPRSLGHQDGRLPADSPAPGRAGTRRRRARSRGRSRCLPW